MSADASAQRVLRRQREAGTDQGDELARKKDRAFRATVRAFSEALTEDERRRFRRAGETVDLRVAAKVCTFMCGEILRRMSDRQAPLPLHVASDQLERWMRRYVEIAHVDDLLNGGGRIDRINVSDELDVVSRNALLLEAEPTEAQVLVACQELYGDDFSLTRPDAPALAAVAKAALMAGRRKLTEEMLSKNHPLLIDGAPLPDVEGPSRSG